MWIILSLLTAFFTSIHDAIAKKALHQLDAYVVAWAWLFFSLPLSYACLWVQGIPALGPFFWWAVLGSTAIVAAASVLYFRGIQASDLSLTMPMLAFTPLFLLVTSPLMLQETPRPAGLAGILLIVGGCYILNLSERKNGCLAPFKSLLKDPGPRQMLMVAVLFSVGANIDKVGVRESSPMMWIATLNTTIMAVLFFVMARRSRDIAGQIRRGLPLLALVGLFNALALICQMYAIRLTIVPYLISIKRMSVVMSSILGFIVFKERGVRERLVGVLLMVAGAFLISVFG